MLGRWQRYWSALFFVLLAVSAGVAAAGLGSGARPGGLRRRSAARLQGSQR
jgi:hypothetical protein